jgi:hypothetical protein
MSLENLQKKKPSPVINRRVPRFWMRVKGRAFGFPAKRLPPATDRRREEAYGCDARRGDGID